MRVFYPPWKLRTRVLFCLALSWHVPRRARRKGDDDALTTVWFGGFSRHAHKCTKCLLVRSFLSFSLHVRSRSFVMEPSSKRFCFSSPEERQRLVDDAIPKRTADSNSFWKSVFLTYCQSIGKTIDFSTVTAADLAPILESFFVDVRGKNGEPYKEILWRQLRAPSNACFRRRTGESTFFKMPSSTRCGRCSLGC